jgi:hypothetical protein
VYSLAESRAMPEKNAGWRTRPRALRHACDAALRLADLTHRKSKQRLTVSGETGGGIARKTQALIMAGEVLVNG